MKKMVQIVVGLAVEDERGSLVDEKGYFDEHEVAQGVAAVCAAEKFWGKAVKE